jgi:3-oxoadipate enol-lactonase
MLAAMPPAGYAANCEAIRDNDLREQVSRISAPTLVGAGTYDAATPAKDGQALAEAIGGAQYVELAAAHLSNWEQPEAFTRAVVDFLVSPDGGTESD